MWRAGVRTVRRGCQAGYATIYSGVEDSVTEDQQESLQNLAAKRPLADLRWLLNKPRRFVQNFANWRELRHFTNWSSILVSIVYLWSRDCSSLLCNGGIGNECGG